MTWHIVAVQPRSEESVKAHLCRMHYKTYLPLIRRQTTDDYEPMFPGYLLVHLDLGVQAIGPIKHTPKCHGVVQFSEYVPPLPDGYVEALIAREAELATIRRLKKGDSVRVKKGVFQFLEGVYHSRSGSERSTILLNLLGTQRAVQIETADLEPA